MIATGSVAPVTKSPGRHEMQAPGLAVSAIHLLQGALTDPLIEDMRKVGDINTF